MVLIANAFYEQEIARLKNEASSGYSPEHNCRGHAQFREAIMDVMRNVAAICGLACCTAQHARWGVKEVS